MPAKKKAKIVVLLVAEDGSVIDELLTLRQMADLLGVNHTSTSELCRLHGIDRHELSGKCLLVPRKQVEALNEAYDNGETRGRPRKYRDKE